MNNDSQEALQQRVLSILNELVRVDHKTAFDLIETRVPAPEALLDTSVSLVLHIDEANKPWIGLLGVINGVLGAEYRISAVFDDDCTKLIRFEPQKEAE